MDEDGLPAAPGSYVLRFDCERVATIEVGRAGRLELVPGVYLYFGSARGPGGLRARVSRHVEGRGRRHWHVDALRAVLPVAEVWYSVSRESLEHRWAAAALRLPRARTPLRGFGSSDCRCPAHLVWLPAAPSARALRRVLGESAQTPHRLAGSSPDLGS